MGVSVRVVKDTGGRGLEALKDRMQGLARNVLVGVPKGKQEPDGLSSAQVLAWLEFGTEDAPERSVLRSGIRENLPKFRQLNVGNVSKVARGTMAPAAALDQLGVVASGAVKQKMVDGPFAPNAPSTIRKKGSSKPTIDTGSVRQNITHVLGEAAR